MSALAALVQEYSSSEGEEDRPPSPPPAGAPPSPPEPAPTPSTPPRRSAAETAAEAMGVRSVVGISRIADAFPPPAQGEASQEAEAAVSEYLESMRGPGGLPPLSASIRKQPDFGNPALLAQIVSDFGIDERGSRRQHRVHGPASVTEDDCFQALAARQRRAEAQRAEARRGQAPAFAQGAPLLPPAADAAAAAWDAAAASAAASVAPGIHAARAAAAQIASQLSQQLRGAGQ